MKALFLVGGCGTRLRPLTNNLPKPMVPVMGKPLLERTVLGMASCGIKEIIFSTCYQPQKIAEYFADGGAFGVNINYVSEETPLGSGGAIKNAERFIDDSFFVCNADILCDIPLDRMLVQHRRQKADITIAAAYVLDPRPFGVIEYDQSGFVTRFTEKPKTHEIKSHYINAGVCIFEPHVLKSIPSGRPVSLERDIFPAILENGGKIAVYRHDGYWMDLGTPQNYIQANQDIFNAGCNIMEADFSKSQVYIDRSAYVDNSVEIDDYAYIGRKAWVGPDCRLRGNCIIGVNAMLGAGCRLTNCIVWPGVRLPRHIVLDSCVVLRGNPGYTAFSYKELCVEKIPEDKARQVS